MESIKGLADSMGDNAPALTLTLLVPSTSALATLCDPGVQGSPVTVSMGSINVATGTVVPDPYVLLVGELDVPTVRWGPNARRLEYRITSVAERLFRTEEGRRLSDSFHQLVWPGELGFAFATGVETWVPWGQKLDLTAVTTRTNVASLGQITTKRT